METRRDKIMKELAEDDDDAPEKLTQNDAMSSDDDVEEIQMLNEDEEGPWTDSSVGLSENLFQTAPTKKEPLYEVVNMEQVEQMQKGMVDKICETLFLKPSHAKVLLQAYKWNVEPIINKFFEHGKEKVLEDVGLSAKAFEENTTQDESSNTEEFECPSCYNDVPMNQTSELKSCGHRFCNDCWVQYLGLKIREKASTIGCMFWKCQYNCDEDFVEKLVDKETFALYEKRMVESFVEISPAFRWCSSTPHCGNAICSKRSLNTPLEVNCTCGHAMCFICSGEPHLPCSCSLLKQWQKKCADDSATMEWMNCNTRDCPECGVSTEKNNGCNHITCRNGNCSAHWCWQCGGSFTVQTVYAHKCPGYREEKGVSESRRSLKRYLHYYDRFNVHKQSRKFEDKTRTEVQHKINEMYKLKPNSAWIEQLWLRNALDVLFITRRALQYSYVLSFYLFDDTVQKHALKYNLREFKGSRLSHMRELFEQTQSTLENHVERLSELMERPIEKICSGDKVKDEIVSLSLASEKRLESLFDLIREEFVTADYKLPDFRHVVTSSSAEVGTA